MRRALLWALVLVSIGGAGAILVAAFRADQLTGQVFFALLPLVMVFSLAWNGLSHRDR